MIGNERVLLAKKIAPLLDVNDSAEQVLEHARQRLTWLTPSQEIISLAWLAAYIANCPCRFEIDAMSKDSRLSTYGARLDN